MKESRSRFAIELTITGNDYSGVELIRGIAGEVKLAQHHKTGEPMVRIEVSPHTLAFLTRVLCMGNARVRRMRGLVDSDLAVAMTRNRALAGTASSDEVQLLAAIEALEARCTELEALAGKSDG